MTLDASSTNPITAIQPAGPDEEYQPEGEKTLFREFAALCGASPEAYRDFALAYGLPGIRSIRACVDAKNRPDLWVFVEPYDDWSLEATELHLALTAWEGYGAEADRLLGGRIREPQRGGRLAAIVADKFNGAISRQIARHSAAVPPTVASLVPHVEVMPGTREFISRTRPTTLIDFIWNQAWNVIKGWSPDQTLCICGCERWIEHPPSKTGPKQKTYDKACRTRVDERNEMTTRRMWRETPRPTIDQIVQATGLKRDRVRRIIESERERQRRKRGVR